MRRGDHRHRPVDAGRNEGPLPRPTSAAHSSVLAASTQWEFLMNRTHNQVVEMFVAQGQEVTTETLAVGPDGQVIQRTRVTQSRASSRSLSRIPRGFCHAYAGNSFASNETRRSTAGLRRLCAAG